MRGHLSFVKNCVAVERIAAELRPHGPQWLVNVIAEAVLPPEDATTTLRRLAPEPDNALWKALCKGELHHFNIENAVWAIIAKTMGYLQFTRIPDSDQYTSLDRLRRTERALSAIIVKLGYRENGTELCLATLIATCIAYHDDCTALDEPTRNQFMRSVILGILTESFTREGALLDQRRPDATLPEYIVATNSLAVERLQRARRDGPVLQNVSQAFCQLLGDEKARHFGVGQNLVPTGVSSAGAKTAAKTDVGSPALGDTTTSGTPGSGKKKTAAERRRSARSWVTPSKWAAAPRTASTSSRAPALWAWGGASARASSSTSTGSTQPMACPSRRAARCPPTSRNWAPTSPAPACGCRKPRASRR